MFEKEIINGIECIVVDGLYWVPDCSNKLVVEIGDTRYIIDNPLLPHKRLTGEERLQQAKIMRKKLSESAVEMSGWQYIARGFVPRDKQKNIVPYTR